MSEERRLAGFTEDEIVEILLAESARAEKEAEALRERMKAVQEASLSEEYPFSFSAMANPFITGETNPDGPFNPDDPDLKRLQEETELAAIRLQAKRLIENDRSISYISETDAEDIVSQIFDNLVEAKPDAMSAEEYDTLRQATDGIIKNLFQLYSSIVDDEKDHYEEKNRWFEAIAEIAKRESISGLEVVQRQELADEVTRLTTSREDFARRIELLRSPFLDLERLTDTIFMPMIDVLTQDLDEDEREEVKTEFKKELVEAMSSVTSKYKEVFRDWLEERTERIYGAAA